MIAGVVVKPLRVIPDERGHLMEILRRDDPFFTEFGQTYLTTTYPDVVKAWHCHRRQDDNVCCVKGMIKLALYDGRDGSPTRGEVQQLYLGDDAPTLVHIPHGVWHGWKGIGTAEAFIINCPTEQYNYAAPDEERRPWDDRAIPYDWSLKNG
ncbi:MAG: dTDP-4-dehydrorhamnose 3,5-epimerase family protein [Armatimonadota bacterium]